MEEVYKRANKKMKEVDELFKKIKSENKLKAIEITIPPEEIGKPIGNPITFEIGPHGDMTYCPLTLGYCPEQCPLHEQNKGNLWDKLRTPKNPNGMEPATIMMREYTQNLFGPKEDFSISEERREWLNRLRNEFKTDSPDCGMMTEKWKKIWNERILE